MVESDVLSKNEVGAIFAYLQRRVPVALHHRCGWQVAPSVVRCAAQYGVGSTPQGGVDGGGISRGTFAEAALVEGGHVMATRMQKSSGGLPLVLEIFGNNALSEEPRIPEFEPDAWFGNGPITFGPKNPTIYVQLISWKQFPFAIDPHSNCIKPGNSVHFHWNPAVSIGTKDKLTPTVWAMLLKSEFQMRAELWLWIYHNSIFSLFESAVHSDLYE